MTLDGFKLKVWVQWKALREILWKFAIWGPKIKAGQIWPPPVQKWVEMVIACENWKQENWMMSEGNQFYRSVEDLYINTKWFAY